MAEGFIDDSAEVTRQVASLLEQFQHEGKMTVHDLDLLEKALQQVEEMGLALPTQFSEVFSSLLRWLVGRIWSGDVGPTLCQKLEKEAYSLLDSTWLMGKLDAHQKMNIVWGAVEISEKRLLAGNPVRGAEDYLLIHLRQMLDPDLTVAELGRIWRVLGGTAPKVTMAHMIGLAPNCPPEIAARLLSVVRHPKRRLQQWGVVQVAENVVRKFPDLAGLPHQLLFDMASTMEVDSEEWFSYQLPGVTEPRLPE